jgi:hypothetical protein
MIRNSDANTLVVDLGDVKLPDDKLQELEHGIRRLVLAKVAEMDFAGDLVISHPSDQIGRTRGIRLQAKVLNE